MSFENLRRKGWIIEDDLPNKTLTDLMNHHGFVDDNAVPDPRMKIYGIACPYGPLTDARYDKRGEYFTRISAGAFGDLKYSGEVLALIGHDPDQILGRKTTGTLELYDTKRHLFVTIYPPNTAFSKDILADVSAANRNGFSVSYYIESDSWSVENGKRIQTVRRARLTEISLTAVPAFTQTIARTNFKPQN